MSFERRGFNLNLRIQLKFMSDLQVTIKIKSKTNTHSAINNSRQLNFHIVQFALHTSLLLALVLYLLRLKFYLEDRIQ
jgi:hypothetical protein